MAGEREGELPVVQLGISRNTRVGVPSHFEPRAPRKLPLKRKQIRSLAGAVAREGVHRCRCSSSSMTAAWPSAAGLGEGRKKHDKRAAIALRVWQREKARLLRARG